MVRSKTALELDAVGCAEEVEVEVEDVGEEAVAAVEDMGDAAKGAELGHVELAAEAAVEWFLASSVLPMKPPARPAMSIRRIPYRRGSGQRVHFDCWGPGCPFSVYVGMGDCESFSAYA
jgi:hypothetical protein